MALKKLNQYISEREIPDVDNRTTIDDSSAEAFEIENLRGLIQDPKSEAGKIMLDYSLQNPPQDIDYIEKRQETVRELVKNDSLRRGLERILHGFSSRESDVLEPAFNKIPFYREMYADTIKDVSRFKEPIESEYLTELVNNISSLKDSKLHKLSNEVVCRQGSSGPIPISEVKLTPLAPFPVVASMSKIRPMSFIITASVSAGVSYFLGMEPAEIAYTTLAVTGVGGTMFSVLQGLTEQMYVEKPLDTYLKDSSEARTFKQSLGEIDELVALANFSREHKENGVSCQPRISERDKHSMRAENLVNLIAATEEDMRYTPAQEVNLENNLHFFTGPNSGGKTTIAKALTHLQILGQLGAYVPASDAEIVPADQIIYQVGQNDKANEDEGGYGSQLRRTRGIFERITPQSLIGIDDLMDGTDQVSSDRTARDMFYTLGHLGANTLMVTHKHNVVTQFRDETNGFGNYLKIGFEGDSPTRQIESGISTDSLGHLVAKRLGINEGGLESTLERRGILVPGQSLYDLGQS